MITREEYNIALDIVEEYQRQIFSTTKNAKRILIDDFIQDNKYEMSVRLLNGLNARWGEFKYLDQISNQIEFRKLRNMGRKCWNEFEDLLHSKGYQTKY